MDRRKLMPIGVVAAVALFSGSAYAEEFSARLNGFQEIGGLGVGETGAIFSHGSGRLRFEVGDFSVNYELTYQDLSSPVTQAHIHFGKFHVAGGIMVWLCDSATNPGPPGTPTCPPDGGTVTGTLTAASVVGPAAQGINPGDGDAAMAALKTNTGYANIHTMNFPAGEIRGQVRHDENGQ